MEHKLNKFWRWSDVTVTNEADDTEKTEQVLFLNGTIAEESWFDDEITPALFRSELMSKSGDITVWINSPGGDGTAAAEIYNMLMDYKGRVTVKIDGIAASAASVIAMAGTKVLISPVAMIMIHNPATIAMGDHNDMQKAIDMLAEVKESIINAYEIKTNLSRNKISRLMEEETWMNAKMAVELGFADDILQRETTEEKTEEFSGSNTVTNSFLFSRKSADRMLINKMKDSRPERKVADLYSRLDLLKRDMQGGK